MPAMLKSKFTRSSHFTKYSLFVSIVPLELALARCSKTNFLPALACRKQSKIANDKCSLASLIGSLTVSAPIFAARQRVELFDGLAATLTLVDLTHHCAADHFAKLCRVSLAQFCFTAHSQLVLMLLVAFWVSELRKLRRVNANPRLLAWSTSSW